MSTKRNEMEDTCYRVPDIHISSVNLTECLSLHTSGNHRSVRVHIHLTIARKRTFRVSLSGTGLNCSPGGGMAMSTTSVNGGSIWCKALVGSHEEGLVTCSYECKCPDVCNSTVAYINTNMGLSLCKFRGWIPVTIALLIIITTIFPANIYHTGWILFDSPNFHDYSVNPQVTSCLQVTSNFHTNIYAFILCLSRICLLHIIQRKLI